MENFQIIDAPLENPPSADRRLYRRNMIDFWVNAIFIGALVLMLMAIPFNKDLIFLLLVGFFFLGVYQFISAAVGAAKGNPQKIRYFMIVITYLALLFLGGYWVERNSSLSSEISWSIAIAGVFIFPAIGAFYYTYLCYDSMEREKKWL